MPTSKFIFLNTADIFYDTRYYNYAVNRHISKTKFFSESMYPDFPGMDNFYKFSYYFGGNGAVHDRTNTLITPFNTTSISPLPEYTKTKYSFEECCDARAILILSKLKPNQSMVLFYGGGVDSTAMVTAFIKNTSISDRRNIYIAASETAVHEPFYQQNILGKFQSIPSILFSHYVGREDYVCVFGHGGDEIFGSTKLAQYDERDLVMPVTDDNLLLLLNTKDDYMFREIEETEKIISYMKQVAAKSPVELKNLRQFFWWLYMCLRWDKTYTRLLGFVDEHKGTLIPEENYIGFFTSDVFQLWAMNNHDKLEGKPQAKEYILSLYDNDYIRSKVDSNNLSSICYAKPMKFAIDENFNYYDTLDEKLFLIKDNSFL
jgi:hypothetical protein